MTVSFRTWVAVVDVAQIVSPVLVLLHVFGETLGSWGDVAGTFALAILVAFGLGGALTAILLRVRLLIFRCPLCHDELLKETTPGVSFVCESCEKRLEMRVPGFGFRCHTLTNPGHKTTKPPRT